METPANYKKKSKVNLFDALRKLVDKHKKINDDIACGKNIDSEITKNFVSFALNDNPYEKLGL